MRCKHPIGSMVKYQTFPVVSNLRLPEPKFHICYGLDEYRYDDKFLDSNESFKCTFLKFDSFPPPPPIALSVVSREVFAPHKMAEIKARHSNEGVPDPRIYMYLLNVEEQ